MKRLIIISIIGFSSGAFAERESSIITDLNQQRLESQAEAAKEKKAEFCKIECEQKDSSCCDSTDHSKC